MLTICKKCGRESVRDDTGKCGYCGNRDNTPDPVAEAIEVAPELVEVVETPAIEVTPSTGSDTTDGT